MTFVPEGTMASCGRNERLNTVPSPPEMPLLTAVPYSVFPDKSNRAYGLEPSPPAKLCRVVKPDRSVCRANTLQSPHMPPKDAVPYRVLPDKTNPANGPRPSLLVPGRGLGVKLYRVLKPVPLVLRANTVPLSLPPSSAVP